jgi:hypothetical protein
MKVTLRQTRGWRLREAPFPFQQTYQTPLKDLQRFVRTLLAPFLITSADISLEQIIFEPRELIGYLEGSGMIHNEEELNRSTLHAESPTEAESLLEQVLGEWIDFAFIPSPMKFAIYADHDEFTTVFAPTNQVLDSIRSNMTQHGFHAKENWTWTGPHSPGHVEERNLDV